MMLPAVWNEGWVTPFVNHLWQSTFVVAIAWLLALTLRNNHARTRYWVWMIASMKFLIPFSLFIAAGKALRPVAAIPMKSPALATAMEQIAQPFQPTQSLATAGIANASHGSHIVPLLLVAAWACGSFIVAFSWWRKWFQIRAAVRAASPVVIPAGIPVLSSSSMLEPGVFGILRPVMLLPEGIFDRLPSAQLNAIIAHEMCHVQRRDNLSFASHMVVETLFWFHPLVWWIRARLMEERELACDESVLQAGNEAEVYAEGILNVCKFYVESPLACVSGVSGSDLKKRIIRIMTEHVARRLDLSRKLLLGAASLAAIAVPTTIGLFHAAQISVLAQAQDAPSDLPRYEVATIKPNKTGDGRVMLMFKPDGVSMAGTPVQMMLCAAFGVEDDRIVGAPGWVKTDRFDIEAKVSPEDAPKLDKLKRDQRMLMLQPFLVDRFGLRFHHETRELPVYTLVIAKGGPRLNESKPDAASGDGSPARHSTMINGRGSIEAHGSSMKNLTHALSPQVDRTILDKTGLTGSYDYTLKWTPDFLPPPPPGGSQGGPPSGDSPPDANGPSLFTAIQEQLGLKLEPQKGPVDVIVIDHIEQPSPN
jgi:bla regulator protein blaR1